MVSFRLSGNSPIQRERERERGEEGQREFREGKNEPQ